MMTPPVGGAVTAAAQSLVHTGHADSLASADVAAHAVLDAIEAAGYRVLSIDELNLLHEERDRWKSHIEWRCSLRNEITAALGVSHLTGEHQYLGALKAIDQLKGKL